MFIVSALVDGGQRVLALVDALGVGERVGPSERTLDGRCVHCRCTSMSNHKPITDSSDKPLKSE